MHQMTLSTDMRLARSSADRVDGGEALIRLVADEEDLAFHAVVPHGSTLKSLAELLVRCTPQIPVTVDASGIVFVACDPASGRLIRVHLHAADLLHRTVVQSGCVACSAIRGNSTHPDGSLFSASATFSDRHRCVPHWSPPHCTRRATN